MTASRESFLEPMQISLDPQGGVAGDMFVASLLDAWPELAEGAIAAVRQVGLGDDIRLEHVPFNDDVMTGSRFVVSRGRQEVPATEMNADHHHVHWRDLRERLKQAPLPTGVGDHALAIFSLLAEAEAGVHGLPVDEATFHEVGAWDSIADIVAASYLIQMIGAESWSISSLPLGRGKVRCAHGELPVPAPATMRLLEGFVFHDDGRLGERVTPTGAAILKHLTPAFDADHRPRRLLRTGYGFGLRRLEGMSNLLRASAFDFVGSASMAADEVGILNFEVDDQTPEDLAIGLDHLRDQKDVLDILQTPAFGKKGRLVTSLRLLVRPAAIFSVIDACFQETTTLGVRWTVEKRAILERHEIETASGIGIKEALRPGGLMTVKAESDDLAPLVGHQARKERRQAAEMAALQRRERSDRNG